MPNRIVDVLKELKQCTLVGIRSRLGILTVMYVEHEREIPSSTIDCNTQVKSYYWGDLLARDKEGIAVPCPCLWIEI